MCIGFNKPLVSIAIALNTARVIITLMLFPLALIIINALMMSWFHNAHFLHSNLCYIKLLHMFYCYQWCHFLRLIVTWFAFVSFGIMIEWIVVIYYVKYCDIDSMMSWSPQISLSSFLIPNLVGNRLRIFWLMMVNGNKKGEK